MTQPTAQPIPGIHHVTALAGDPLQNLAFYTDLLGLRLVKKTVNFDDPSVYHLYYGDEAGRPGTILTFFPWPNARRGQRGVGQATTTAFSVPSGSLGFWAERLARHGVDVRHAARFDEEILGFQDPDGLALELVAHTEADAIAPWSTGPVSGDHAVRGFHSVALTVQSAKPTLAVLRDAMGWREAGEAPGRLRLAVPEESAGDLATRVDLLVRPDESLGRIAAGTVHHVAFRVADEADELAWREHLVRQGQHVTEVKDRQYFRSIYFREPGGVLFELATDPPGFTWDEPLEALGKDLKLPPWLEPMREQIERMLIPLNGPGRAEAASMSQAVGQEV